MKMLRAFISRSGIGTDSIQDKSAKSRKHSARSIDRAGTTNRNGNRNGKGNSELRTETETGRNEAYLWREAFKFFAFSILFPLLFILKVNHIRGAQQEERSTRLSRRGKGCATLGRIRENRLPRNIELLSALICAALRNAYSTRHIHINMP